MKSDKGFLDFLGSGGIGLKVVAVAVVGILLIFFGSMDLSEQKNDTITAESRAEQMCSMMEGVGDCRVMMTYHPDDTDRVYAVLVLCDGADSPMVRRQITSLFTSLYGIGANRVEIGRLIE